MVDRRDNWVPRWKVLNRSTLLNRLLGSGAAIDLIAQAETAGTITNTRTGIRLSPTSGAEIAANGIDYYTVRTGGTALRGVNVMATATNLVDEDLVGGSWTTDPNITKSEPSTGVYRFAWDGLGTGRSEFVFASASNDRAWVCQARLISGAFDSDLGDFLSFRLGNSNEGGKYALEDIGAEWQDVLVDVTSVDATDKVIIMANPSVAAVLEFRYTRVTDTATAMAPFEVGSSAGATYASDDITITGVAYPSDALLIIGTAAYHWSGTSNPETTSPRYFDTTGSDCLVTGSVSRVNISGNADVTGQPVDSQTTILTAGWDGVNVVARYGDGAETSIASAGACSGTFTLGTGTSIVRTMHANMFAIMIDQAAANLTDAEQKSLALDLGHGTAFNWTT